MFDSATRPGDFWTEVDGLDLEGEADVQHISNWSKSYSIDDLKKICIDKNYSGFTLGKEGTWAADGCWFKKVDYQLQSAMMGKNSKVDKHYFYTPPNGGPPLRQGTWTKHVNLDLPGRGDVAQYSNWK